MGVGNVFGFWHRLKLRVKGPIVIAIPVIPLLLFFLSFLVTYELDERNNAAVSRALEMRFEITNLLNSLLNAESAARGFLLTDDEISLQPYQKALQDFQQHVEKLQTFTLSEPFEKKQFQDLRVFMETRFGDLRTLIESRRKGVISEEALRANMLQAKSNMDSVDHVIESMLANEDSALQSATKKAVESRQRTRNLMIAETLFAILGGVAAIYLFMVSIVHRIQVLSENTQRIAAGQDLIAIEPGGDAISELAQQLAQTKQILAENEAKRRKSEKELENFFSLSLDLLCIAGFDGYFKRINSAWEQTLGYSAQELLSRPYTDFIHPDDRSATAREAANLNAGMLVFTFENRYRCRDGSYRWFLWNAVPLVEEKLIYATARDVTERKEIEAKVKQLNQELEQRLSEVTALNKELEAFTYSVSHDLRAPLRHINGFADLLRKSMDGTLDEKSRRYLDVITGAAKQMGLLIDDLLVFSRMGRAEMTKMEIDTDKLLRNVLNDFQSEIEKRNIEIEIHPLPTIHADGPMLRLVLVNLISNAVKYTSKENHPRIEIGCDCSDPKKAVFYVKDNGAGFDMKYSKKLFGVFQRLHSSDDFEGTGIGLANVRRIIHRHGGETWAEGVIGAGATFYFDLPQQEVRNDH